MRNVAKLKMFDLKFYKLMKERQRSEKHYLAFELYQGKRMLDFFKRNNIDIKNRLLLDIGCGRGGYSLQFRNFGANVVALDLKKPFVANLNFVKGDATELPFKDNSFDIIFSSSLIEHLPDPEPLIKEIKRTLKERGVCYLSFPPFYSPVGGHQFKPFHYLPEDIATWLSRKIKKVRSYKYDDQYGGLYRVKISDIKKLIIKNNLKIKKISTRFSLINFAKIPILNELLTWNVEFILKKT